MPPQPPLPSPDQVKEDKTEAPPAKQLPKGVVLGPDGKPCRSCTSAASWMKLARDYDKKPATTNTAPALASAPLQPSGDCPPDVEELGRSSWTLLHAMTATYPERPSPTQQSETRQFVSLFGKMYPCWVCAEDFQEWMNKGNAPRVSNRAEFGKWMCDAHNEVNVKLGKPVFDCNKWEERWRTGPADGRCG